MWKQRFAVLAIVLLAGCSNHSATPGSVEQPDEIPDAVQTALEKAPAFELLSLDPKHPDADHPSEFLRRKVIGKAVVTDAATRRKLLDALDEGARTPLGVPPACFDPRHAIRVQFEDKTFYLTICFECNQVCVFVDDRKDGELEFNTADSPERTFDEVLSAAGVPLAEKGSLQD
jgi:hypothetical protein